MPCIISTFIHNNQLCQQFGFFESDNRVEIQDENGDHILTFTSDCYIQVKNEEGQMVTIGHLATMDSNIHYRFDYELDGYYRDAGFNFHIHDAYYKAEVEIAKVFMDER